MVSLTPCAFCGIVFVPYRAGARFCSDKCRVYWNRRAKFPRVMTDRDTWVRADGKRPIRLNGSAASSTDAATWHPYSEVRRSTAGDGFGFMLGGGIGCYDLDGVTDADARDFISEVAEPVLFTERSVSGRGFHVFIEAAEGKGWKRGQVERYTRARFIRVTGEWFRS